MKPFGLWLLCGHCVMTVPLSLFSEADVRPRNLTRKVQAVTSRVTGQPPYVFVVNKLFLEMMTIYEVCNWKPKIRFFVILEFLRNTPNFSVNDM